MLCHHLKRIVWCSLLVLTVGCAKDPTAALVQQLGQGDVAARRAAARELGKLGNGASSALPALHDAASDTNADVRRLSIYALGQLGTTAESSLPTLTEALDDRQISVRLAAALAIQKIDPDGQDHIPVLVDALRRGEGGIILEVGKMGPSAPWAVPPLITLLSHRRGIIREVAASTLGQIGYGAAKAEPALQRAIQDANQAVSEAAKESLRKIQAANDSQP